MSLDNVIAVAAAAGARAASPLLVIGLAISIPLIIFGSTLLMKVMERFPIIITLGAALLGLLAGEMFVTDPAVSARFGELSHDVVNGAGAVGAVLVVAGGLWLQRRDARRRTSPEAATYNRARRGVARLQRRRSAGVSLRQAVSTKRMLPVCRAITITPCRARPSMHAALRQARRRPPRAPRSCAPCGLHRSSCNRSWSRSWNSSRPAWWSALLAIVLIDLVLAGDNAIVIALAARSLPAHLQKKAIVWGTVGAIVVRTLMTLGVVWLLQIPGLMLVGGLGLVWIAYKLLVPQDGDDRSHVRGDHLLGRDEDHRRRRCADGRRQRARRRRRRARQLRPGRHRPADQRADRRLGQHAGAASWSSASRSSSTPAPACSPSPPPT